MKPVLRQVRAIAIGVLVTSLGTPLPASAAAAALGIARGVRDAELSLDGGRRWLSLENHALPAIAGSQIRTTTGSVVLDLADGSRVALAPFSALRVEGSEAIEVRYGRVEVRAVPRSGLGVMAGSTRVAVADHTRATVAELVVDPGSATGVRVREGAARVEPAGGASRVARAGDAPVVIGAPAARGAMFGARTLPLGATGRAAFTAKGRNVGYLAADGSLVVRAGFARDLSSPFASRTVTRAFARIPEPDRDDAAPIFDVEGRFLGYVRGASFHALAAGATPPAGAPSAQPAPATPSPQSGATVDTSWPWHYTVGILAIAGGVGVAAAVESDDDPASPNSP